MDKKLMDKKYVVPGVAAALIVVGGITYLALSHKKSAPLLLREQIPFGSTRLPVSKVEALDAENTDGQYNGTAVVYVTIGGRTDVPFYVKVDDRGEMERLLAMPSFSDYIILPKGGASRSAFDQRTSMETVWADYDTISGVDASGKPIRRAVISALHANDVSDLFWSNVRKLKLEPSIEEREGLIKLDGTTDYGMNRAIQYDQKTRSGFVDGWKSGSDLQKAEWKQRNKAFSDANKARMKELAK